MRLRLDLWRDSIACSAEGAWPGEFAMFASWYAITMLGLEANSVIGLRLARIARGGAASFDEMWLMWTEKLLASAEARAALATGVGADGIVALYRSKVALNEKRLSPTA